jgi:hypothetical protein
MGAIMAAPAFTSARRFSPLSPRVHLVPQQPEAAPVARDS